jgi:hypothetical protein
LIEEALAEQRSENKRQLQAMLADPSRFTERDGGWQFAMSHSDLEWLLQVLNDIRVGSWIMLDLRIPSPAASGERPEAP